MTKPRPSVTLTFSEQEFDLILAMMQTAGVSTIAGVVHVGLWRFAEHLDLDPPIDIFLAAPHVRRRRRRSPHAKETPTAP